MEHHRCQGHDGVDTDIPTRFEGMIVTKTAFGYVDHTIRKAIFMFFQIFAYALRPCIMKPGLVPFDRWMFLNWFVQFSFDGAMIAWCGPHVAWYFLISVLFAGSIHP